ncbi:MAG TPA: 3'-5' exonuclease, partial [Leptolyngbyaceae cyanobacterium]
SDSVSLKRVINVPKRGIGKSTLEKFDQAAQTLGGVPLWEILSDETSAKTLAGRSSRGVVEFANLIQKYRETLDDAKASEIIQGVLEDSGYIEALKIEGTDDALERVANVQELYNAALQFEEENEDTSLLAFLSNASLASDRDDLKEGKEAVSLMTLHSSKGLEFPVVFLVGMEQGLFPNFRSLEDPAAIEEERRLCYVGITRAKERLFISHARSRRLYGNDRQPASPSLFLGELPTDYVNTSFGMGLPQRMTTPIREVRRQKESTAAPGSGAHEFDWSVGDRVVHNAYGAGEVTHIFGAGNKICLAVQFPGMGRKIIDPKISALQRVE